MAGPGTGPGHLRQTVLVLGTGGVALFALQFAKLRGARVIALSSSDEKLERAKALGADNGINYRMHPQWGPLVRETTSGIGVDAVIETVCGATLAQSLDAVVMHGFIGMIGFLGGGEANVSLLPLITKRVRLEGISVAPLEAHERMVAAIDQHRAGDGGCLFTISGRLRTIVEVRILSGYGTKEPRAVAESTSIRMKFTFSANFRSYNTVYERVARTAVREGTIDRHH